MCQHTTSQNTLCVSNPYRNLGLKFDYTTQITIEWDQRMRLLIIPADNNTFQIGLDLLPNTVRGLPINSFLLAVVSLPRTAWINLQARNIKGE